MVFFWKRRKRKEGWKAVREEKKKEGKKRRGEESRTVETLRVKIFIIILPTLLASLVN